MSEHGGHEATGRQAEEPPAWRRPAWGTPPLAGERSGGASSAEPGRFTTPAADTGPHQGSWAAPGTDAPPAPNGAGPAPAWGPPPEQNGAGTAPPERGTPPEPPAGGPPDGPPLPQQRDGNRRSGWGKAAGAGAGAAALAGKAGLLGKALLLFKGLAVLAKFKVLGSMLLSVGVYALFWGWQFALGFVVLLAVHEFGHIAAARARGVEVSAPMFIPMVGAFVAMKDRPRSVADEAWTALAGPAAGLLGSIACLELAQLSDSLLLRALAYTSFLLNLFNLVPALPLDGGRVAGALHPGVWLAGIGVAVVVLLWRPSPVLGFVLVLGAIEAVRRWREHRSGQDTGYHRIPATTRGWIATAYVAAAALCLWGMHVSYVPRPY
jgi:Zn-dependent protease